jgi:hypothetical protein
MGLRVNHRHWFSGARPAGASSHRDSPRYQEWRVRAAPAYGCADEGVALGARRAAVLRARPQVSVIMGARGKRTKPCANAARLSSHLERRSSSGAAALPRPRLRPRVPRRWCGRFAHRLLEDASLRAWGGNSRHRPCDAEERRRPDAPLRGSGHCDALVTARDTFDRGTGRTPVLDQRRIAYGARCVRAAAGAGANVRRGLVERLHDSGQAAPSREHRDENRDDNPQLRNELSHATDAHPS